MPWCFLAGMPVGGNGRWPAFLADVRAGKGGQGRLSVSKSGGPRPLAAWWETARLYRDGIRVGRRGRMAGNCLALRAQHQGVAPGAEVSCSVLLVIAVATELPRSERARLGTLGVL